MLVTLSERRLSEQIRQLEGIDDTVEEITHRMDHYAGRLFKHLNDGFGIRFVGMAEQSGGLGTFQFDISGVGRSWQMNDWDWDKMREGLRLLNPVSVSIEERDMENICTGLIATMVIDSFDQFAGELQRITVGEVQSKIEAILLKLRQGGIEMGGQTPTNEIMRELEIQAQFARAGLKDPLQHHNEVEEYRRQQEAEYAEQEAARKQASFERFFNQ